jgi:hypothetical protein
MPVRLYSQEMKQWLRDNVKGRSLNQLTEDFNEHFGTSFKTTQIGHLKGDLNLRNGNDTKFKKGCVSANKGQKMSEAQKKKIEHTWFKKGQKPINYCEVGTERINVEGYVEIKTINKKWVSKHRLVWEQHHGPIPKGYTVVFLDDDTTNCNIDNLRLISRPELMRLTSMKLQSTNSVATEAGIHLVSIIEEIKKREKELENNGYE